MNFLKRDSLNTTPSSGVTGGTANDMAIQAASMAAAELNQAHQATSKLAGFAQAELAETNRKINEMNIATAEAAASSLKFEADSILQDLKQVKGSAAVNFDFESEIRNRLGKMATQSFDGMDNDHQRNIYESSVRKIEAGLLNKAKEHRHEQITKATEESMAATVSNFQRSLMLSSNQAELETGVKNLESALDNIGKFHGQTEFVTVENKRKHIGAALDQIVDAHVKSGNIQAAQDVMTKYQHYMQGKDILSLRTVINEEVDKQAAVNLGQMIANANGGTVTVDVPSFASDSWSSYSGAGEYNYTPRSAKAKANWGKRAVVASRTFSQLNKGGEAASNMMIIAEEARALGLSSEQAAVIASNVFREHGATTRGILNKNKHGDAANGKLNLGMFNWQGPRAKEFEKYIRSQGMNPNNLNDVRSAARASIMFMKHEMNTYESKSGGKFLKGGDFNSVAHSFRNYIRWDADGTAVLGSETYNHAGKQDGAADWVLSKLNGGARQSIRVNLPTSSREEFMAAGVEANVPVKRLEKMWSEAEKVRKDREEAQKKKEEADEESVLNALVQVGGDVENLPIKQKALLRSMSEVNQEKIKSAGISMQKRNDDALEYSHMFEIQNILSDPKKLQEASNSQILQWTMKYGKSAGASIMKAKMTEANRKEKGLPNEKGLSTIEKKALSDYYKANIGRDLEKDEAVFYAHNLMPVLQDAANKKGAPLTDAERYMIIRQSTQNYTTESRWFGLSERKVSTYTQKPYEE